MSNDVDRRSGGTTCWAAHPVAGYIVLAWDERNGVRVCSVGHDGTLVMSFSGTNGTLFKTKQSAQKAIVDTQEMTRHKPLVVNRQYHIIRLRHK